MLNTIYQVSVLHMNQQSKCSIIKIKVTRLEAKVLTPLANYGLKCKHAKNDIKEGMKVQDLEVSQRKKLDRLRQKSPADRAQLTMAETELQKASVKASAMTKNLEQLIDKFEEEKLKDLKVVNIVHFISLVFFLLQKHFD